MWVLAIILIVALMIPVAAILVDSPLELRDLQRKVDALETEVEDLNRTLAGMRDELQFVQRLLEDPHKKKPAP